MLNLIANCRRTFGGIALLEVLASLVIFTVGMLGIAGMLLLAHRTSASNYIKQQAVQLQWRVIIPLVT